MPSLFEEIEASAAQRLTFTPGADLSGDLPHYSGFLKAEFQRLRMQHRHGAGGLQVCRARARLVDLLLDRLWAMAKGRLPARLQQELPPIALVALGGYGRAELNPASDLALMFLHEDQVAASGEPLPCLSAMMDGVLYPLWDLQFKVGHSVRTVAECVEAANGEMQTKTSLLEGRLIAGDPKAFARLEKALQAQCVKGHVEEYVAARLEDQQRRHAKWGSSPTMQEPNLKNGCGGLRDYQSLCWIARVKYGIRSLAEMEERGFLGEAERKGLEMAYDYLLAVRTELHDQLRRPADVLTRNVQLAVATVFDRSHSPALRRLERFMRQLYMHFREIHLVTRTLTERLALAPHPSWLGSIRSRADRTAHAQAPQLIDGLHCAQGQIQAAHATVFRDQPGRLMRLFLHAQQRGLRLHPDLTQLVRQDLSLVDSGFLRDENVGETFLEILNQPGNVAPVLRTMHEVGLLGRYLPEFGKLTCLVQHEFFHQYAADEHTLVCLEKLDRVWEAQAPPYQGYAELFRELERPFVLYLALLLHDAGKAAGTGRHSEVGGQLALRVSRRLGLDGATTHSLRLLIEQHLAMASISQRRDLDDPSVITHFAGLVQSEENLRMLALHTFADSMATSDKLWNGFKDQLLRELYHKTLKLMRGGADYMRAELKQKELLMNQVMLQLPEKLSQEEVLAHFNALPPRYFVVHTAREIVADLALVHRFLAHLLAEEGAGALAPAVAWHDEPNRGCSSVKVCTWDRAGLFSKIAGSLSASGINILSAQIFTRTDALVLDTFFVTDTRTGDLVSRAEQERFELLLRRVFTEEQVDIPALIRSQQSQLWSAEHAARPRLPTNFYFDNQASQQWTVLEVETEDQHGLLYCLSKALAELDINIFLAKILTEKGAAIDSFYISELDGAKILSPERQQQIATRLQSALARLG